MPLSGNLGDTLNVMPILSGIYNSTGHKIYLVVRNKMKMFEGFKEFMEMQPCIAALKFESDVVIDEDYVQFGLTEDFLPHPIRPWETCRFDSFLKKHYNLEYEIDDDFVLEVPDLECPSDLYLVGDRTYHKESDKRRSFDVLKSSEEFTLDKVYFLDYNLPVATNAAYIKASKMPLLTTFTGISVVSDLLKHNTVVIYGEDIKNWDDKHISYSFNKHFYRDRNCALIALDDFYIPDEKVTHEDEWRDFGTA